MNKKQRKELLMLTAWTLLAWCLLLFCNIWSLSTHVRVVIALLYMFIIIPGILVTPFVIAGGILYCIDKKEEMIKYG